MASNGLTSTDIKNLATTIREEDLSELEDLRRELQAKADKALEDGRIFMAQTYIGLIADVSPTIKKIRDRFAREALASFRKAHKGLKAAAKAPDEQ